MDSFFGLDALLFLNYFSIFCIFNYLFFILITFFSFLFVLSFFLSVSFFVSLFLSFFLSFILTFLLRHVADRVLELWPAVRPVPLRWESRVQDIGPLETSWLHVISNSKSSPSDLHLNGKTQLHSTTSNLQCWTHYTKKLAKQEQNPTH